MGDGVGGGGLRGDLRGHGLPAPLLLRDADRGGVPGGLRGPPDLHRDLLQFGHESIPNVEHIPGRIYAGCLLSIRETFVDDLYTAAAVDDRCQLHLSVDVYDDADRCPSDQWSYRSRNTWDDKRVAEGLSALQLHPGSAPCYGGSSLAAVSWTALATL